jgi:hypothetical protein
MLLKPSWIHWKAMCHQEVDKFISRRTEIYIRRDCTFDEHWTEYRDPRSSAPYCNFGCSGLISVSLGFSEAQSSDMLPVSVTI